jgi:hypothetical protein
MTTMSPQTPKKKTTTNKLKSVYIKWLDAHDELDTWIASEDIEKEPCVITSLGFLIENGKPEHVTLAQSYSDELLYNNIIYIPNAMVIETKNID